MRGSFCLSVFVLSQTALLAGLGDPERAWPSVVQVLAGNYQQSFCNQGSGVVVEPDKIVTNYHVVEGKTDIRILPRGKQSKDEQRALLIWWDGERDLALLGITSPLPTITMAPEESFRPDNFVHVIGYPGGSHRITSGRILGVLNEDNCQVVQTSADMAPGNSGGALVDDEGRLVGISTRMMRYQCGKERFSANEAIHASEVIDFSRNILGGMRRFHRPKSYGYFPLSPFPSTKRTQDPLEGIRSGGLSPQTNRSLLPAPPPPDIPTPQSFTPREQAYTGPMMGAVFEACDTIFPSLDHRGAKLTSMESGGAADHAGMRIGDVVMMMNDIPIGPVRTFASTIKSQRPGSQVALQLLREGLYKEIKIVLGNRWAGPCELPSDQRAQELAPENCPPQSDMGRLGMVVGPCPAFQELPPGSQGLKILSITPGAPANYAHLEPGDVILGLNGKPPGNAYNFVYRLHGLRAGSQAKLQIYRGGKSKDIQITIGG